MLGWVDSSDFLDGMGTAQPTEDGAGCGESEHERAAVLDWGLHPERARMPKARAPKAKTQTAKDLSRRLSPKTKVTSSHIQRCSPHENPDNSKCWSSGVTGSPGCPPAPTHPALGLSGVGSAGSTTDPTTRHLHSQVHAVCLKASLPHTHPCQPRGQLPPTRPPLGEPTSRVVCAHSGEPAQLRMCRGHCTCFVMATLLRGVYSYLQEVPAGSEARSRMGVPGTGGGKLVLDVAGIQ